MPSASVFKKAFNLDKGAVLHSPGKGKTVLAEVQKSAIGHTAKKRNELYEFPSTIDLKIKDQSTTQRRLVATIKQLGERIAYSAYGSPYSCSIENIKIELFDPAEAHAIIKFLGKAIRRRDTPTLGKQKEEEREKKATAAKKRKKSVPIKDIQISKEGVIALPFCLLLLLH
ncbi:hypothetical protein Ndes2437B_g05813 [Nannochloris sp. 'desiccata']